MTSIEWTDETWNPAIGCSRVSEGCRNCYAERFVHRGLSAAHAGLTVLRSDGPGWTGEIRLLPERLEEPIRWRKARRIFVCSLSDLFHPEIPFPFVAAVLGVIAETPRHRYQILTKRPERARAFLAWLHDVGPGGGEARPVGRLRWYMARAMLETRGDVSSISPWLEGPEALPLPLPNLDLLVSVEDQRTADKRIPELLDLGSLARTLGVSYEPALGPVDFTSVRRQYAPRTWSTFSALHEVSSLERGTPRARLDWIIVGGESGPGARPFDLAWARSTVAQCREAGVACFVKQLGSHPIVGRDGLGGLRWSQLDGDDHGHGDDHVLVHLGNRKGGDLDEWPADLRVRELPR